MLETYVLVNGYTLWRNASNLMVEAPKQEKSSSEFRFKVQFFQIRSPQKASKKCCERICYVIFSEIWNTINLMDLS